MDIRQLWKYENRKYIKNFTCTNIVNNIYEKSFKYNREAGAQIFQSKYRRYEHKVKSKAGECSGKTSFWKYFVNLIKKHLWRSPYFASPYVFSCEISSPME